MISLSIQYLKQKQKKQTKKRLSALNLFLTEKVDFCKKKGYNKVMKKIFAKIFSMVIVLCMCVLGTGCFGVGDGLDYFSELFARFESGEITEEEYYQELAKSQESAQLYGTKVLYRPESYDYSGNSGGTQEEENDYYGKYAWQILSRLELIYGVANMSADEVVGYYTFNTDTLPYLYDSIRYQVDKRLTVTQQIAFDGSSWSESVDLTETNSQYIALSANLDNAWNWSFDYDVENVDILTQDHLSLGLIATPNKMIGENRYFLQGNRVQGFYQIAENTSEEISEEEHIANNLNSALQAAYANGKFTENYLETYVGPDVDINYSQYSDFVKALEYVIYCYSLDLTPGQVIVEPVMTTTQEGVTKYYSVKVVETSNGQQIELSADQALEQIKEVFEKLGSYVGVAERNKAKISKWILDNVIGSAAMQNDSVTEYIGATQISYTDAEGTTTTFVATSEDEANAILEELKIEVELPKGKVPNATSSTTKVYREYEDTIVNLVDKVCEQVTIGSDDDGQIEVDERYLASEVMEYMGNSFSAGGGDDPFPYFEDFSSPQAAMAVKPLEYQSAVFMFKDNVEIGMVSVALQYDADLDGYQTRTGEPFDHTRYLTIEIGLNYFNHQTKQRISVDTQTVNVPDGKLVSVFEDTNLEEASEKAGITFSQVVDFGWDVSIASDDLIVGAFKTDIGGGILKTDVGKNNYRGNPIVSKEPIVINGLSSVKDYYEILEPTEDQIAAGQTYLAGQLNPEKFMGDDGCDYLEVTYRVIKRAGDTSTNYKFYTGITAATV